MPLWFECVPYFKTGWLKMTDKNDDRVWNHKTKIKHRLCGSASPLITATHHSDGSLAWLSDFFPTALEVRPPTNFHANNGSNNVFSRKAVPFAVKIATFHTPWSPGPPKGQNLANFNSRSIWPLTLEVQSNESDIVNRQSGGEKLKYVLKFYIGDTHHVISRMRNDDSTLCLRAHDVWGGISRKPLKIETWVPRTTNRKWTIPSQMTARDPERSRYWPRYA